MSSEKSTLYLHLGLHKTGSNFLQKEVFPNAKGLYFLNKPDWSLISDYTDPTSLARFMASNTGVWDEMGDVFFNRANKEAGRSSSEGGDLLISDEQGPFGWHRNDPQRMAVHLKKIQSVMREQFDELKVLIVIRRQDTWLASAYAEICSKFKQASQGHFERWIKEQISYNKKYFWGRGIRLDYSSLLAEVTRFIPAHNVKMIPYELLKSDPGSFIGEVAKFIEVDTINWQSKTHNRKSLSNSEWKIAPYKERSLWLRPGRLFYKLGIDPKINIPDPFRSKKIEMTPALSRKILSKYKSSNQCLDSKIHVKEYGYVIDE
ncbi:hypothetical protein CRI94_14000 [Longibacter salinarum]|uniref:Sulfotransferase domain-containing protein n=1 Tax=Longibacter salinarum TaxID=1850348 RepID=A0A2A8CVK7_9BACT|nr:sulfotransferase domain-containing protein [Longibacter salinarum]PEN12624.1 hypothetical protein CRI94_14000 [Longibacter salinarum]